MKGTKQMKQNISYRSIDEEEMAKLRKIDPQFDKLSTNSPGKNWKLVAVSFKSCNSQNV